jgi:membrane protein
VREKLKDQGPPVPWDFGLTSAPGNDRPRRVSARAFAPQIAQRAVAEFSADHCAQLAASVAYHVLFSVFPLAIVLAGVFGIVVHATGSRADVVDTIASNVPLSASGDRELRRLLDGATGGLSALGLFGIVGLVYAASGMMAAIRVALNAAFDVAERRPFLRGKLVDLGLVLVAAVVALASLGITIAVRWAAGDAAGGDVGLGSGWAEWLLGVVVPLAGAFGISLFLYRLVPPIDVALRDVWPAALFVACAFVAMENLFAVYVANFANYNAIYGSLGAVIAFMFFVYLSALVFLLGAEVASEWPRVRERLERGEVPERSPLQVQVRQMLEGLWVQRRQEEAGADPERPDRRSR